MKRRKALIAGLVGASSPLSFCASLEAIYERNIKDQCRDAVDKILNSSASLFHVKPGMIQNGSVEVCMETTDLGDKFFDLCEKKDLRGIIRFSKRPEFSDG